MIPKLVCSIEHQPCIHFLCDGWDTWYLGYASMWPLDVGTFRCLQELLWEEVFLPDPLMFGHSGGMKAFLLSIAHFVSYLLLWHMGGYCKAVLHSWFVNAHPVCAYTLHMMFGLWAAPRFWIIVSAWAHVLWCMVFRFTGPDCECGCRKNLCSCVCVSVCDKLDVRMFYMHVKHCGSCGMIGSRILAKLCCLESPSASSQAKTKERNEECVQARERRATHMQEKETKGAAIHPPRLLTDKNKK